MKYAILIVDGAAGEPLEEYGGRTCLEMARTPNLDALVPQGTLGRVRTVPPGFEPSSACACMSVLGYDPRRYRLGRAAIEATSLGIPVGRGEVVFRCNLVTVRQGRMVSYSAGHIGGEEARQLFAALNEALGSEAVRFFPGVGYRGILRLRGRGETRRAVCTPPHDIPGKPVAPHLPRGEGSAFLRELMAAAEAVLAEHPVNRARRQAGLEPATGIWPFWGSGPPPPLPPFYEVRRLRAAMTSGVDLLAGLARLAGLDVLDIPGVSDGLDNDYAAQVQGALAALADHDLVVIHVESPDEAAHSGLAAEKVRAIEAVDREMVSRLYGWRGDELRLLVLPDHPTPLTTRTHSPGPVPFLLWGAGFGGNGARRFTEAEAARAGLFLEPGYVIMDWLVEGRSA